jgi:hypothetical protein
MSKEYTKIINCWLIKETYFPLSVFTAAHHGRPYLIKKAKNLKLEVFFPQKV